MWRLVTLSNKIVLDSRRMRDMELWCVNSRSRVPQSQAQPWGDLVGW